LLKFIIIKKYKVNAYNHSYRHWISLCTDPMMIVLNARSYWDELPPYDHFVL